MLLRSAEPPGFVEGRLKISSVKTVELASGDVPAVVSQSPPAAAEIYREYPLVVLARSGQNVAAVITADTNGDYRVALAPGEYILDIQDRAHKHVRAKPEPFQIASNQTVRVERIRIALRRAGVAHIQLRTDRDWVQDIARFVLAYRRVASLLHTPPQGVSK